MVFIQTLKLWSNELASRRKFSTACVSFGQLYAWEDNTEVHYFRFARDFQHLATQRKLAQDDCNCKCVKLTAFGGFASQLARQFFWAPFRVWLCKLALTCVDLRVCLARSLHVWTFTSSALLMNIRPQSSPSLVWATSERARSGESDVMQPLTKGLTTSRTGRRWTPGRVGPKSYA